MEQFEESNPQIETFEEPRKRRPFWLVAGILLIVLLGGAAFMAGRLMNRPAAAQGGGGGPQIAIMSKGPGGAEAKRFELQITPASELPTVDAAARGILTERKDNSLFVGTGNVTVSITAKDGIEAAPETSYDGSVVEVVITQDTKIYRDVTEMDMENPETAVQQEVELSSIEDIGPQSNISAWGRKVGDRIIAEVIFFSQPFLMKKAGGQ